MNIIDLKNRFRELYGSEPEVIASAPGRIDLLNTHQDYKGLTAVGAGINLRTYVLLRRRSDRNIYAYSLNLDKGFRARVISPIGRHKPSSWRKYVWAIFNALLSRGVDLPGLNVLVYSDIPVGGGLGSSGALEVALIAGLNELFNLGLYEQDIAEIAYYSEHDILSIPCGRLDQYTSTYGDLIAIEMKPPYRVTMLKRVKGVFGVIYTGIKHSTEQIHSIRQMEINMGIQQLLQQNLPHSLREIIGSDYHSAKWELINLEELVPYLAKIDQLYSKRIIFTLLMNQSTRLALDLLIYGRLDHNKLACIIRELNISPKITSLDEASILGIIMTYQHKLLSELYDVSLPIIDTIVKEIIELGALGAKLSGAGLGGSIVALFSSRDEAEKALRIICRKYNMRYWVTEVDKGVTVSRNHR